MADDPTNDLSYREAIERKFGPYEAGRMVTAVANFARAVAAVVDKLGGLVDVLNALSTIPFPVLVAGQEELERRIAWELRFQRQYARQRLRKGRRDRQRR